MSGQIPIGSRNCFRCGDYFPVFGNERICVNCRKPKHGETRQVGETSPKLGTPLSFREDQVVELVAQGKINKEISWELHLTEGTVKEYLNRIFRKMGIGSRTELAVRRLGEKLAAAQQRIAELEALNDSLRAAVRSDP